MMTFTYTLYHLISGKEEAGTLYARSNAEATEHAMNIARVLGARWRLKHVEMKI